MTHNMRYITHLLVEFIAFFFPYTPQDHWHVVHSSPFICFKDEAKESENSYVNTSLDNGCDGIYFIAKQSQ